MMFASGPGFVDHQQGDGYSHRGGYNGRLDFMADWFNDEQLKFGGTKGEQGKKPEFTSHVYPGKGKKTVFRTGWGNKDYFMHLNADGGQGNHAHQDDLSMTIFANGRYLLVDPLYGSYNSSDPVRQWLISAKGHNTIRVNGQGQTKSKSGSLEAFETNNLYDFVRMSTPNTPSALKHERNSMFMRSNFWVVSDYIVPKDITKDNKYEQYWHMLPEANITMEDSTKTVRTNFQDANIQVVPVEYGKYNRSEILEGWYSEGQNSTMKADYVEYE
ncbi:MAG: heparinase II/III-family protein, partial [Oscillospiraceae bacterium]